MPPDLGHKSRNFAALQTTETAKPLRLSGEDLEFLIYHKAALRFQHAPHDAAMQRDGQIKGDAYSLSYPKEWHPASDDKAKDFQSELKLLVASVIEREMTSRQDYAGSFLLLSGVDGAHKPVTDKLYRAPFYPVGACTTFLVGQRISAVPVTPELALAAPSQSTVASGLHAAAVKQLAEHLTSKLVDQIITARVEGRDKTATLKAASQEQVTRTARMQRMSPMFR